MKESLFRHLLELTALNAVSGAEEAVAAYMAESLRSLADRVEVDGFGNVVAVRQGPSGTRSLMVVVHSDEVGCVVQSILPNGMLRVEPMGWVSLRALPGTRVRVGPRSLPGVVGVPPAHLESGERELLLPFHALHVDVGACSETEARALGLAEGDSVAFDAPLVRLSAGDLVTGKALDNRVGCSVLLELFDAIRAEELSVTLIGAVAVQEEIGMRGARMIAHRWHPDVAVAVDTVPAEDVGALNTNVPRFSLGGGPVVQLVEGVMSAYAGTVHHPAVKRLIMRAAREEGIPVQVSVSGRWTTDAAAVHITGEGIPTGFVSIPRRYAHSPVEVLDLNDAARAVELLVAVVRRVGTADLRFL